MLSLLPPEITAAGGGMVDPFRPVPGLAVCLDVFPWLKPWANLCRPPGGKGGTCPPAIVPPLLRFSQTNLVRLIGRSRIRLPVAAKIAAVSAGAITGAPGSPTPAWGAFESTMVTSILDRKSVV